MAEPRPAMLSVAQAWERLSAGVPGFRPAAESIPVVESLGRVLVAAPRALLDVPGTDKSAMDGFAVRYAEVKNGEPLLISQRIAAGDRAQPLVPGTAARIFTGAMLPDGADCVVIQENCRYGPGQVTVISGAREHAHIRRRGEDIQVNDKMLHAGHVLRSQDIGLLISAGIRSVRVFAPLRVAVIATGDELLDISADPVPEKTYESNSPMIAAALGAMGCHATRYRAADTHASTREVLMEAVRDNDAVITIGGVSVGEEDHVQDALRSLGEIEFWKIRVKPGKPFLFGTVDTRPVLGLPGNPVSSLVTFGLFCRPFINQLRGGVFETPATWTATSGFSTTKTSDRDEYLRGTLERRDGQVVVQRLTAQGSGMQTALCAADVLIAVPSDTLIAEGETLQVIPLRDFAS